MHNAPSVTYPVGRSSLAGALLGTVWACGALCCLAWWWQGAGGWRLALMAAVVAIAGACAWRAWVRSAAGTLAWSGECWTWHAAGKEESGAPEVSVDLQAMLLVRWNGDATHRWLWLERANDPPRWADLRRAVYSRARPDALRGANPPTATP